MSRCAGPATCATCAFYASERSVCRRYPPSHADGINIGFPHVVPEDWCGEYRHRDQQIIMGGA